MCKHAERGVKSEKKLTWLLRHLQVIMIPIYIFCGFAADAIWGRYGLAAAILYVLVSIPAVAAFRLAFALCVVCRVEKKYGFTLGD